MNCKRKRATTVNQSGNTFVESLGVTGLRIVDPANLEACVSEIDTIELGVVVKLAIGGIFSIPESLTLRFDRIGSTVHMHISGFTAIVTAGGFFPTTTSPIPLRFRPPVENRTVPCSFVRGAPLNIKVGVMNVTTSGNLVWVGQNFTGWAIGNTFQIFPQTITYTLYETAISA